MTTFKTALTIAAAGLAIAACHKTGSNAGSDVSNPGQSAPVNAAQDVAAGPVGMAASTVAAFDTKSFVTNAAIGGMYEVEAGKIALKRSKAADVKKFAQMMITDHTKMGANLKTVIAAKKIAVEAPTVLDARRQGMIDNLNAAGDADFDGAYLHQQLAAHLETLNLLKGFQNHGDNAALQTFAGAGAPTVEKHIAMIRKIGGDKLKDVADGSQ